MTAVSQACLKSRVGLDCPVLWGDYHPHSLAQQSKHLSFCVLKHPHPTCRPSDRLISRLEYRDLSLEVAALFRTVKLLHVFTLNLQKLGVTAARLLTSLNGLVNLSAVPMLRGICEGNGMRSECQEMVQKTQYCFRAVHYDGERVASITGQYSAWNVLTNGASIWQDGSV